MRVYYSFKIFDTDKRLLRKTRKYRSRSFLKPFLYIFADFVGGQSNTCSDTGGTSRSTNSSYTLICAYPGLDSYLSPDTTGIQVGTGNTAVALTDYALQTPVAHGTGAGQMLHLGTYPRNLTTGANTASFDLECMFKNSSGGSIVVAESGIYGLNGSYYFCLVRDVLGSTVTVADGEYLLVTYTIQIAV